MSKSKAGGVDKNQAPTTSAPNNEDRQEQTKKKKMEKKEEQEEEVKSDVVKSKRYPLLSFKELPDYMKDNEYILRYYRANWPLKQAFFSVFRWHNETLNVWT